MRLAKLTVTPESNNNLYDITVRIVYGDDDLVQSPAHPGTPNASDPNMNCLAARGSQFCAVSELSTTVEKRL